MNKRKEKKYHVRAKSNRPVTITETMSLDAIHPLSNKHYIQGINDTFDPTDAIIGFATKTKPVPPMSPVLPAQPTPQLARELPTLRKAKRTQVYAPMMVMNPAKVSQKLNPDIQATKQQTIIPVPHDAIVPPAKRKSHAEEHQTKSTNNSKKRTMYASAQYSTERISMLNKTYL